MGWQGRLTRGRGGPAARASRRLPPGRLAETLAGRVVESVPVEAWLLEVADGLHGALDVDAVEIWTGPEGVLDRVATHPYRPPARLSLTPVEVGATTSAPVLAAAWVALWLPALGDDGVHVAPLRHGGALHGLIVVRTGHAAVLGEDGAFVLADAARRVAVVLENARLDTALRRSLVEVRQQAEELRASRARIAAAGDAERRRIERDLHDGAQQHLVALAVDINLAREVIGSDPVAAAGIIDALPAHVDAAIASLRDLALGIYPPALTRGGVRDALRALALESKVAVSVVAPGFGRYPAEIESALYFFCSEAIQNAAKHAGRHARVTVELLERAGVLEATVADDGRGFDATAAATGSGLANMSDRIGAVGGTVEIRSTPAAGTRVRAAVPLP